MPPVRNVPPIKPMKTERTHEENQERAYIAASRRSDRSLEARIESARRASEIHKKRTGRGLRVTEQDVINEEMYEEEDEDMPSQYQRLSAHLHTNSLLFNRKLQDYIATQAAVRQSFYAQYQNQPLAFTGNTSSLNPGIAGTQYSPTVNPFMHQQMPPPQTYNQTPQNYNQNTQPFAQQGYRTSPYSMAQRPIHQRSASLSIPQHNSGYQTSAQVSNGGPTTPGEEQRRLSLPPKVLEQASHGFSETQSRPSLSRSNTAQSTNKQATSPQQLSPQLTQSVATDSPSSVQRTPTLQSEATPGGTTPMNFSSSQLSQSNLFSLSLPPESQQLVAPALDPKDPAAAMFMAGSENIPMPVTTYHYNPNLSPKSSRMASTVTPGMAGASDTLAPEKMQHGIDSLTSSTDPPSLSSDDMMFSSMMSNSLPFDFGGQDDLFQSMGLPQSQEDYDPSIFINFDQS